MADVGTPAKRAGRMHEADLRGGGGWASIRNRLRFVARVQWSALRLCALGVWSMATRKASSRNRALQPSAEDLESRQLLSKVVSGTDIDGDKWTLRLIGPGSLNVTKQPDAAGNPSPLNSMTQINTITIGGTDPLASRLMGKVHKAAGSDGKVFFQSLDVLASRSLEQGTGLG